MKKIIGFLLWMANASPPMFGAPPTYGARERFYRLKDRLLRRYGQQVGYDIQHIKKECWSCDGTGIYTGYDGQLPPRECWNCNAGIYAEFWTKLERWQLGGYVFHSPIKKSSAPIAVVYDDSIGQIEGYIRHKTPKYYLAAEALYWLALFFDWKLFAMTFGHCVYVHKKFTPMVIAATALFCLKMILSRIVDMPRRIKYWVEKRERRRWVEARFENDELPF